MKILNLYKGNRTLLNLFTITLLVLSSIFPTYSKNSNSPLYKIYVLQVIQHPALDASRQGIYDELIQAGYKEGLDFTWSYNNAQGNVSFAAQIAQVAIGDHADAIVTLGTLVTQTALAANKDKNIPIIFASVTDPVEAKIVKSIEKPEGMATGVSNLTPSESQFRFFKELQPDLKILGIVYNPGEANSQALLKDMKQAAERVGLELVFATASKTSEVQPAATKLAGIADAFYVNNDNTALAAFDSIIRIGLEVGKPAYVSDTDLVQRGALAALGPDQYQLGRQVGKMLIRVLKGENPREMPVEYAQIQQKLINMDIAQKLGIIVENKNLKAQLIEKQKL